MAKAVRRTVEQLATAGVIACVFFSGGCEQAEAFLGRDQPPAPGIEQVRPYFAGAKDVKSVDMNGNVVELTVRQPYRQLERGGSIWARVGPYIYLMTPATRSVFSDFPGVAAVRVTTVLPNGDEVARAMLERNALSDIRWRRTLNLLGHALREGRDNPRKLEELTAWSEQYTDFHYNPKFVKP